MSGPCSFVIFGAAGHLATTKLIPALYRLDLAGRLDDPLQLVAFTRREHDTESWRRHVREVLEGQIERPLDRSVADRFVSRFAHVKGDLADPVAYQRLFEEVSKPRPGVCENMVFYLAIRPVDFQVVISHLDAAGLNSVIGQHRVVIEKPFGTDLDSARRLNAELHRHFTEEQVYRIDHFLGKETVQNLVHFRFSNAIIEPLWNRDHIDHVQIMAAESDGVGTRAGYFDRSGTLRDMVQNHLLQLLAVTAMEPPARLDAESLRDEKVKVLRSIRPFAEGDVEESVVRARYVTGQIGGQTVPGYLDEAGVAENSNTESFVAARFHVDNWRWRGVPFYLRTGKRMQRKRSLVAIRFRDPPHLLFPDMPVDSMGSNWLTLSIQPEENIRLQMYAREPGLDSKTRTLHFDTVYRQDDDEKIDAYQSLLLDVIEGDRSLFIRFDEVEESWAVVEPILQHWKKQPECNISYEAGSWGPSEAERLFIRPHHAWRNQA